jgi:hypothetical protein
MTRVKRNTRSISSRFGTRPNSSWRATAILAFKSFLFCSGVGICYLYQNSWQVSSIDTLILRLVLIITARLSPVVKEGGVCRVSKRDLFETGSYISFLGLFGVNIPEAENVPGDQQRSEKGTGQRSTSSFKYRRRSQPEDPERSQYYQQNSIRCPTEQGRA